MGVLQITKAYDLSFFKNMEHLDAVMLRGGELDLTVISQMSWLEYLELDSDLITDIDAVRDLKRLRYLSYESKGQQAKTIHGWAEHDVRNGLYEVGVDLLNDPASLQGFKVTAQEKQKYLEAVIEDYYFSGNGKRKYDFMSMIKYPSCQVITKIYERIEP